MEFYVRQYGPVGQIGWNDATWDRPYRGPTPAAGRRSRGGARQGRSNEL